MSALIAQSRKTPVNLIRKLDRAGWDRLAEESACVSAMGIEVQGILPIDDSALRGAWHNLFIAGDNGVVIEVQSCILSRTVAIRDVPSLNRLIKEHAANCPVPAKATVATMNQLERDSFDLLEKQVQYDLQALRIAKSKRSTWEASIYHVKLQHKLDQHAKSRAAAQWFFENFVQVIHGDCSDDLMRQFQLHRGETISRLRLEASSCVLCLEELFFYFCLM